MTATPSPNLQLPKRPMSAARGGGGPFVYVLLFAVIALQVALLVRGGTEPTAESQVAAKPAGDPNARAVALKLEDRNLHEAAADAWTDYLAATSLPDDERAAIHYRIGKLLQQAQRFEHAVAAYYCADALIDENADLHHQITLRVRECLQKLGRFSDLTREMAQRAGASPDDASLASRQIVAEIGDQLISVADFDRMLTERIEQSIAMQPGLADTDLEELRRQAHAQFNDPQVKAEQLQQMVASQLLAEEARHRHLHDDEAFRRQLSDFADRLLASRLMLEEAEKRATVTPQDVERYYEANKSRYADPAQTKVAQIVCASEESANEVMDLAASGTGFAELARGRSLDEHTRNEGGVLPRPITDASTFVPGFGQNETIHNAIMTARPGTVLAQPFRSDIGWHVFKVVSRMPRRQHAFEDVRDRVERDVRDARRAEVTEQYLRELFKERNVRFYPQAFVAGATDGHDQGS